MTFYICSRYRSDDEDMFFKYHEYTKEVSREVVFGGHDAIVPHLYYPQFLDDGIKDEREVGMRSALNLLRICDAILVNTKYGISDGMRAEIVKAEELGMMILYADSVDVTQ